MWEKVIAVAYLAPQIPSLWARFAARSLESMHVRVSIPELETHIAWGSKPGIDQGTMPERSSMERSLVELKTEPACSPMEPETELERSSVELGTELQHLEPLYTPPSIREGTTHLPAQGHEKLGLSKYPSGQPHVAKQLGLQLEQVI